MNDVEDKVTPSDCSCRYQTVVTPKQMPLCVRSLCLFVFVKAFVVHTSLFPLVSAD